MVQNRNQKRRQGNPPTQLQRVLVVDDDPVIRDMMMDILECEGYVPELARNGQEALRVLAGPANYLVFLDLMMPICSGKDLCEILATRPLIRQHHVLVLMSAMDHIAETYQLDVDMVMPKPFVVDDVAEALETYMH